MNAFDARAVANLILDMSDLHGIPVGPLALQKILYFQHGWWLAKKSRPLIRQSFEAWNYGPVVRLVYDAFKDTASGLPIKKRAMSFDYKEGREAIAKLSVSESEKHFLRWLFLYYARISDFELVKLTHCQDGPWDIVWNEKTYAPGMIIDNEIIKSHFDSLSSFFPGH